MSVIFKKSTGTKAPNFLVQKQSTLSSTSYSVHHVDFVIKAILKFSQVATLLCTCSFPNLGIQHVTKKSVGKVLMDRYIKMQTLHTATLHALTADNKVFDVDQALADGDRATFDRNMAEAVAGTWICTWI